MVRQGMWLLRHKKGKPGNGFMPKPKSVLFLVYSTANIRVEKINFKKIFGSQCGIYDTSPILKKYFLTVTQK